MYLTTLSVCQGDINVIIVFFVLKMYELNEGILYFQWSLNPQVQLCTMEIHQR